MARITISCFKWLGTQFTRKTFRAWQVNRLHAMLRAKMRTPFDFVCVTDQPKGIDPDIRIVPLWPDLADVPNPHGPREPACYRRLKLFSAEAADLLGERVLNLDLDMVVTGDLSPLLDRPEPVVLLQSDAPNIPTNGSVQLISPGVCADVWNSFDPKTSPGLARRHGCYGSDQGWISYHLLHGCLKGVAGLWKTGPGGDGIWFYGQHMRRQNQAQRLPQDARLVSFHGRGAPWLSTEQLLPWVQKHYGPADGNSVPDGWR